MRLRTPDRKLELLGSSEPFSRCSRAELSKLALVLDQIDYPAGHVLQREGTSCGDVFVVLEGTVSLGFGCAVTLDVAACAIVGDTRPLGMSLPFPRITAASDVRVLTLAPGAAGDLLGPAVVAEWVGRSLDELRARLLPAPAAATPGQLAPAGPAPAPSLRLVDA